MKSKIKLVSNNGRELKEGSRVNYGSDGLCYIYEIDTKTLNIGLECIETGCSWDMIEPEDFGAHWLGLPIKTLSNTRLAAKYKRLYKEINGSTLIVRVLRGSKPFSVDKGFDKDGHRIFPSDNTRADIEDAIDSLERELKWRADWRRETSRIETLSRALTKAGIPNSFFATQIHLNAEGAEKMLKLIKKRS